MQDESLIPVLIPKAVFIEEGSKQRKLDNIARNLPILKEGEKKSVPLVIACYGPSLKDTWPQIAEMKANGAHVLTMAGSHDFLLDNGIIPDYHAEMDAREDKLPFFTRPQKETNYLLAAVCHPKIYEALKDYKVTMWFALENAEEDIEMLKGLPEGDLIVTGSTIGLGSMALAHYMGYTEIHIHGMDSSSREGERHAGKHYGKFQKPMKVRCGGRYFDTTAQMIAAAREFSELALRIQPCDIYLYGDGLTQEMTKEGAKLMESTLETGVTII